MIENDENKRENNEKRKVGVVSVGDMIVNGKNIDDNEKRKQRDIKRRR